MNPAASVPPAAPSGSGSSSASRSLFISWNCASDDEPEEEGEGEEEEEPPPPDDALPPSSPAPTPADDSWRLALPLRFLMAGGGDSSTAPSQQPVLPADMLLGE